MSNQEDRLKTLIGHAKEYGFVFPSSEIYDGLSATYDYGPYGVELKNNIRRYWWEAMTKLNENIVGIDAAIFMHPTVWKASGHVDAFNDPLIDNKDSKKRYRADVLLEEHMAKYADKIAKEMEKAKKKFGEAFDEAQFRATNPNVKRSQDRIDAVEGRMKAALEANDLEAVRQLIIDEEIKCPISGTANWTEVRQFNLMFATELGSVSGESSTIYLRPETAQGHLRELPERAEERADEDPLRHRADRQGLPQRDRGAAVRLPHARVRADGDAVLHQARHRAWSGTRHWKEKRMAWHRALGLPAENYRFHDHIKLAHYANAACDIEFKFPMGFKELEGIHSRTDFDLGNHEKHSGKKLRYFDPETNESYVPYVVETSIGLDRMFLAMLSAAYQKEKLENGEERVVLRIPAPLAPVKVAVLPLIKKDGLPEKARAIIDTLKLDHNCQYDEKDSIGKRYRRQDAIGTPYCITVDHDSLTDDKP
jgi:glycyl-tRNA synthetase